MRRLSLLALLVLLGVAGVARAAAPATPPAAAPGPLPVVDGVRAVAVVNGEPISLTEVGRQLASLHMQADEDHETAPARQDPSALLERMITAKLVSQEARVAGFDEDPEFRKATEDARRFIVRDMLVDRQTANLKPDPAVVERYYKDYTREYTMGSIFFRSEKDAQEFEAKIKAGGEFFKTAKATRDAGKATGPDGPQKHRESELRPSVAKLLSLLKPGQTGPVMKSDKEWAVVHLVSVNYPSDPDARAQATAKALEQKREEAINRYSASLRAKYATVDEKLLASLDFQKKGAFAALAKDTRTLATIKGDAPVTVADLAKGMERRYFHGAEQAATDPTKHVNTEKRPVLDDVINRRVVALEGKVLKLEDSREFKERAARAEDQLLFEMYVKRAILPEVKITDADLEAYYAKHQKDYSTPEMVQLDSLAFSTRAYAQDAFTKLQKGADWNWLEANAKGRLSAKETAEHGFPAGLVVMGALPAGAQKAIKGARKGDYRFYEESATGPYLVMVVRDLRSSEVQKLEAVKKPISEKVYAEELSKAIERLAADLRKGAEVKVYATGDQLKRLIMKDLSGGR
jgi:hypothetical protein